MGTRLVACQNTMRAWRRRAADAQLQKSGDAGSVIPLEDTPESLRAGVPRALNMAAVLLWEARTESKFFKNVPKAQWPLLIRQIESQLLLGRAESGFLTRNRALSERTLLLAPTYYRGFVDFLTGFTAGGVVGSRQALVLSKFLAGSLLMFYLVGKQLGMDEKN